MSGGFCAKKYLSYFCVTLFFVFLPLEEGGFVAMGAAVARISNKRKGRGRSRWRHCCVNFRAESNDSGVSSISNYDGGVPSP